MSETPMKLYQTDWCPYCQRVQKKFADLGIPYVAVTVPDEKAMREELFLVSGQRGVPTLVDGDVVIADDDDAIIAHVESRYSKTLAAT